MAANDLRVTRTLVVPAHELQWHFSRSGGPGGQHVNTSDTRVELCFDVVASGALGPRQRARLLEAFGPVVRVVAAGERSQARNREVARRRLAERLAAALVPPTRRKATTPSRSSKQRRLDEKHRRSERKQARRWQPGDDG